MRQWIIVLLGIMLWGVTGASAQHIKLLTPPVMELGTIPSDTIIHTTIRFMNDGKAPLILEEVKTSCGCTAAEPEKMTIQPGEESAVQVSFNSRGYRGEVHKYVTLISQNAEPRQVRVTLHLHVRERIEIHPRFLEFRIVNVGDTPVTQHFTIRNHSGSKLKVSDVTVSKSIFSVKPRKFEIPAGDSVLVQVTVRPGKPGQFDDVILVRFQKPKKLIKRVPVFLKIQELK